MKRNLALDILRGITIFGMILVNNPGPGESAAALQHCSWDGCSMADLVFPFFLFIVGASIYFAFARTNFEFNSSIALKIIKRSLLIFGVGYLLGALWFTTPIGDIRIMSALQRIAIVYLIASMMVLTIKRPAVIACITGALLLVYWAIVHFTDSYSLQNNWIAKVDASILGESRIYSISGAPFDPEGIVATISSLCNALIGFVVASILVKNGWKSILALGVAMVGVAFLWDIVFPFNKPLWSSSFVLLTCGYATLLWGALTYLVDERGVSRWGTFFRVFGTNAIFAYVLSQLLASINYSFGFSLSGWLFDNVYGEVLAGWLASLTWSLIILGLTWGVTYLLYRRKIFLKL